DRQCRSGAGATVISKRKRPVHRCSIQPQSIEAAAGASVGRCAIELQSIPVSTLTEESMADPIRPLPEIEPPEPTVISGADSTGVSKRRYSRSKLRRPIVLIPLALILIVATVLLWRYFGSYESTDDAQVDVHLYPVSARISGYVIKVNVGDNEYVKQGTVLVEVDPRDYE